MAITTIGKADLHSHTTASDGMHPPAEVVALAAKADLAAIAITDHDTVAGVEEAMDAGAESGILVVPGVELSTNANGKDIHILGYFTDNGNEAWLSRLRQLREARMGRNERIVEKLRSLGMELQMEDVESAAKARAARSKRSDADGTIGRPHIAEALIAKGFVADMEEAFRLYLAEGAAAYVSQERVHPREAIRWIKDAGGTSVIAHPGIYGADAIVESLCAEGVDGIEVFHSDHGPEDELKYAALAERFNLIATGGSDFHGMREDRSYHGDIGGRSVDAEVVRELARRADAFRKGQK